MSQTRISNLLSKPEKDRSLSFCTQATDDDDYGSQQRKAKIHLFFSRLLVALNLLGLAGNTGAHPGFSQWGGGRNFSYRMASRVRKINLT